VVTERVSAMEPAITAHRHVQLYCICTLDQDLCRENFCQTAATRALARLILHVLQWGYRERLSLFLPLHYYYFLTLKKAMRGKAALRPIDI